MMRLRNPAADQNSVALRQRGPFNEMSGPEYATTTKKQIKKGMNIMQKLNLLLRITVILALTTFYAIAGDTPPGDYNSRCQQALTNMSATTINVCVSPDVFNDYDWLYAVHRVEWQVQPVGVPLDESNWSLHDKILKNGHYNTYPLTTTLAVGQTLYVREICYDTLGTSILMTFGPCYEQLGKAERGRDCYIDTDNPANSGWHTDYHQGVSGYLTFDRITPISGGPLQRTHYVVSTGPHDKPLLTPIGLYIDPASQKIVYVGYDETVDARNNNINFIPDVTLPLPVSPAFPGWCSVTPIKVYGVTPPGLLITSGRNRWCLREQEQTFLNAFAYVVNRNPNNMPVLTQENCDFSGLQPLKSVGWWENAKTLTYLKNLKIPDDIGEITGLYVDKASQKTVYVGPPAASSGTSIIFIPDAPLPLPVPPAYPEWGDINPVECYTLRSGYILTGDVNRWCLGNNTEASVKKFSYYVTEDIKGNINLIQGDCDFSGLPPSDSLTWWKNAKVLIKIK